MGMLEDLFVLDLSRVLAGPYCTLLLADMGARVVKVESHAGDDTRRWGPPYPGGESGYYLSVNRGKESVVVDLKDPRGRELVQKLASKADVIVENYKVGDLERYGLDYAAVAAGNPAVIYVSITGFGQDGPRAKEPGYDAAMQAQSGLLAMTGTPEGAPVKLGVAWIDVLTGVHAATGALAALHHRESTGVGLHLDVALLDVAIASLVNQAQAALLTGEAPARLGSAHPSIVPYQAFEAADGAVVVAVGNDGQFARFCGVVGHPEWATNVNYATNDARVRNRATLVPLIAGELAGRKRGEFLEACRAANVPATPVATLPEALVDPQVVARGMVISGEHPTIGALPMVASPLWHARGPDGAAIDLAPAPNAAPVPPLLGADSRAVLLRDLNLTEAEADELIAAGVVGQH